MNAGQVGPGQVGPGQVGLVRSWPGPILSQVGMCLIKKVYSTKVGGRLILRNKILCAAYSIFYTAPRTLYQLMSVDIECPCRVHTRQGNVREI